VQDFSKECLLRKSGLLASVPHYTEKTEALSFLMNSTKEKILSAMNSCEMTAISEGVLYYSLFKNGVSADDATKAIQDMLKTGVFYRNGCALILADGMRHYDEKNPSREGALCTN
jgi:hypothetical protein